MSKTIATVIAAAAVLSAMAVPAKPVRNACDATAKAASRACANAARDDFWIATGKCKNVSDDDTRKQCLADAKAAAADAKEECGDQLQARQDLCAALGQAPYEPVIDPADFVSPAAAAADPNPYFPLVPGTVWVYEGGGQTITVTVTDRTKDILNVSTRIVTDTVRDDHDVVIEDTEDYFAQHADGTVWYFGEISKGFENGELASLEGTWRAGADGAKPGIIMKATPMGGDVYRQEFALGVAEDAAEVISTTGTESVPGASCSGNCVVTRDFSPLAPGADEHKYYAQGVGLILEVDLATGERVELTSKTP